MDCEYCEILTFLTPKGLYHPRSTTVSYLVLHSGVLLQEM
jgi:hypothetical protein